MSEPRIRFTAEELSALLAVIRGAQDDDDGDDPVYSAALASSHEKIVRARAAAREDSE